MWYCWKAYFNTIPMVLLPCPNPQPLKRNQGPKLASSWILGNMNVLQMACVYRGLKAPSNSVLDLQLVLNLVQQFIQKMGFIVGIKLAVVNITAVPPYKSMSKSGVCLHILRHYKHQILQRVQSLFKFCRYNILGWMIIAVQLFLTTLNLIY